MVAVKVGVIVAVWEGVGELTIRVKVGEMVPEVIPDNVPVGEADV